MFVVSVLKHLLNWKYLAEAGENKIMNPPWGNKTTVFLVRYSKLKSVKRQISKSLNFSALISYPFSHYPLPLTPYTPISSSFPPPFTFKNTSFISTLSTIIGVIWLVPGLEDPLIVTVTHKRQPNVELLLVPRSHVSHVN